jgi:hypothetical protein
MRQAVTLLTAAVLLSMITVMPLIACPFLKLDSDACCPRTDTQAQKCPLSTNIESCPFYVTETKLGIKVAKFAISGPPLSSTPAAVTTAVPVLRTYSAIPPLSGDLYLLNRVLLI